MIKEAERLELAFRDMEKAGEVDLRSSLPIIENLASELKLFRNNKINFNESPQEIFKFYHSSITVSVVLQNMRDRLREAKERQDNPISVLSSLKVMPLLKEVVSNLEAPGLNFNFIDSASKLQLTATKNNLFKLNPERLKIADNVLKNIASNVNLLQEHGRI